MSQLRTLFTMSFGFIVFASFLASTVHGDLVIRVTELGGDTTFQQTGTFDETGLTPVLGFGANGTDFFRHTFASVNDFWVQSSATPDFLGHQGATFTPSANWTNPGGSLILPTVLAITGDFGFYVDPTNLRVASSDTPGSITVDASFADLGFTFGETLIITNPNNNDTFTVTTVPEPASFFFSSFALIGFAGIRRRRA